MKLLHGTKSFLRN